MTEVPGGHRARPGSPPFPGGIAVSHLRVYDSTSVDGLAGGTPHCHTACTEAYAVVAGCGRVITLGGDGHRETPLEPGSFAWFTPGTIHRLVNDSGDLEILVLMAPTINSYKRLVEGMWAPTRATWGVDNRTCALRLVGHGHSLRVENRVPGGDVNQYLAVAGMLASGLYGIEHELDPGDPLTGNAYTSDIPRVPTTLREAADLFDGSALAREIFGDEVVDHYVHAARTEVAAFDSAITDWERVRGFERL